MIALHLSSSWACWHRFSPSISARASTPQPNSPRDWLPLTLANRGLEHISLCGIRHARCCQRSFKPFDEYSMLCLLALKHPLEGLASYPILFISNALLYVPQAPPCHALNRAVDPVKSWVTAPRIVRRWAQPHLPLELPARDDALHYPIASGAARACPSLAHYKG